MGNPAHAESLLEREAELMTLDAAIGSGVSGRGALIVLEGQAGIGKTALLMAATNRAKAAGMIVADAIAAELESDVSYGVVRQLFEPIFADVSTSQREGLFAGAAGLAAPVVSPRASANIAYRPADDTRFPVVHGLFWVAVNLAAEAPVMVVVDDAQWCDRPSLRFLTYLSRRIEDLSVVVVIAFRVGEGTRVAESLV